MARSSRILALGALAALLCAFLGLSGGLAQVVQPGAARQPAGEALARVAQAVASLVPGVLAAVAAYVVFALRDKLSFPIRLGLAVLLLTSALTLSLNRATGAAQQPRRTASVAAEEVGQVNSGEEVLMSDGNFVRLPDPTVTDGSAPGSEWRQGLSKALVTALAQGQEQVVIMFTRDGCPWCDKQIPVLQDAIRRRAGGAAAAADGADGSPQEPANFLEAPLRVFVFDAAEFPQLMQQFQVEGFPTNLVFGRPRVTPLMNPGFLDEEAFEDICRAAAEAEPEVEGAPRKNRKKRRGLFR